jgi:hypothetical protein
MSTLKQPMLSSTHAIFRGLQEHIQQIFHDLPASTPNKIKNGLFDTHWKLSNYYYKYDQSPFYTGAAHTSSPDQFYAQIHLMAMFLVLDPWISYEGMSSDYMGDEDLLTYLKSAKSSLTTHYILSYATHTNSLDQLDSNHDTPEDDIDESPSKVNFTSRYK